MEEAAIAKIATEALKPVSTLIDAVLGPKLKRLKIWVEKRDLNSRLGSTIIDVLLDSYLRRLLRRICGVTTIVFPQQSLPLTSIYEPLQLSERYKLRGTKKFDFNIDLLKEGQNFFIVDSAGMGKSTFAKHLVLEIINSTSKIPIFFELRRIGEMESLLEKLSLEIDETKKDINEELLIMLLELGNFVIILDGYDELPDHLREKIGKQITELTIRCDKNSLILTTRPEVSLPELPDCKIFAINSLSQEQAASLVLRYDAVANIDVGKRLIEEFSVVPKRFLETPLLVALLYRTYGFNQSIATRVSSFYDEIYNAMYKGHDLSKSGFARVKSSQLDVEDFRRLLRGFSFILAIHQKENIKSKTEGVAFVDEAIRLTSVKPVSSTSFFEDLLLAVPLFVKDGTEFRFIHKSIGEFFTAEFLAYQQSSERIIENIRDGHLGQSFITVFEYLSDINPNLFRRLIVAPLAKSILTEKNRIQDPYIHSISYFAKAYIGLWPYDQYMEKLSKDKFREPSIPSIEGVVTISYFYGNLYGKRYILTIGESKYHKKLPTTAWELITIKSQEGVDKMYSHDNYDFDGISQDFITEQWISIDDDRIMNNASHPAIRRALANFLSSAQFGIKGVTKNRAELRIFDEISCKNLLEQIRCEDETQGWLNELLSKSR